MGMTGIAKMVFAFPLAKSVGSIGYSLTPAPSSAENKCSAVDLNAGVDTDPRPT